MAERIKYTPGGGPLGNLGSQDVYMGPLSGMATAAQQRADLAEDLKYQVLQERYEDLNKPLPKDSTKSFWNWLQDFGSSLQSKAEQDPTLSTLGALGHGFSGASIGLKKRRAEAAKLKGIDFQNLGLELSMLTAGSKVRSTREKTRAAALKTRMANMPWTKLSPTQVEEAGYPKGTVAEWKYGHPMKVSYKGPETLETWTYQDRNNPENTQQVRKDDVLKLASLNASPKWQRVTTPPAAKRPWRVMTSNEIIERKLNPLNKYEVGPENQTRIIQKHDPRTYTFQDTNPKSPTFRDQREVGAEDGAELALLRRDPNWNLVKTPAALKKGTIPLTEENTAVGEPQAEWRPFFEKAKAGGDTAVLNLDTNQPSLKKPTPKKLGSKAITAEDVGPGGDYTYLKGMFDRKGPNDTLLVDLDTMKPSYMKATAAPDEWSPATPEDLEKPEWKASLTNMPWGMYAEINKKNNAFRYKTKPKMSYLTFSDPEGIKSPVTVREDETDYIDQLKEAKMIKQNYQGDLATAGSSMMARWKQGRENTNFGDKIIDMVEGHIQLDRDTVGAVAKVKGMYQTGASILADIADSKVFGTTGQHFRDAMLGGQIEEEALNAEVAGLTLRDWFNPLIPANEQLEQTLIYTIAMANKPSGRLNLQDLQRAEKQVKVTGFVSVDDVITSLNVARKVFDLRAQSYGRLIRDESPFEKPKSKKKIKRMRRIEGGCYEVVQ